MDVDPRREFADVVLMHSAPELTTSVDGVVPSSVSGAPYDAVVQTDLRGVAWTFQVGRLVGRLDEGVLETLSSIALGDLATDPAHENEIWTGSALTGEGDRRWAFKADEGSVFRILTRECTVALIEGGTVWEIDPGLLRQGHLDCATGSPEVVQEFWEWRSTRRSRPLTVSDDLLVEMLAQDPPMPSTESDLAFELATLAWELAAEVSTETPAGRSSGTVRGLLSAEAVRGPGHEAFGQVHFLGERVAA
ncbi:MAG: hypothetical protein F4091_05645 [Acidimicrobiales bacterium]|nr:hypothetical protein [Acidimicrobiales bacterium]MYD84396.1 hypothetical protein [Acidimicrobiales bacterium]MYJ64938.1 hypothetical protein [Acidimicrobiales bacterium]